MSDPRKDDEVEDDKVKDDVIEYFGADGEDEGEKYHETGDKSDVDDQTIVP